MENTAIDRLHRLDRLLPFELEEGLARLHPVARRL